MIRLENRTNLGTLVWRHPISVNHRDCSMYLIDFRLNGWNIAANGFTSPSSGHFKTLPSNPSQPPSTHDIQGEVKKTSYATETMFWSVDKIQKPKLWRGKWKSKGMSCLWVRSPSSDMEVVRPAEQRGPQVEGWQVPGTLVSISAGRFGLVVVTWYETHTLGLELLQQGSQPHNKARLISRYQWSVVIKHSSGNGEEILITILLAYSSLPSLLLVL